MKRILTITTVMMSLVSSGICQITSEEILNTSAMTSGTGGTNNGYWTKIISCEITAPYQDCGNTFELFGNGGADWVFFYGTLVVRVKCQSSTPTTPTNYSMILMNSNIGAENIKGKINGTQVDIYVRINRSWTKYFVRPIARGLNLFNVHSEQPFLSTLPNGTDITCVEGGDFKSDRILANLVWAKEIKVDVNVPVPDYVFEQGYALMSLDSLSLFITEEKHLPGIPSASEINREGIEIASMNLNILQKIEELTLYVIQLKKADDQKSDLIKQLMEENQTQSMELEKLKSSTK